MRRTCTLTRLHHLTRDRPPRRLQTHMQPSTWALGRLGQAEPRKQSRHQAAGEAQRREGEKADKARQARDG
jgi:hypothetical protein